MADPSLDPRIKKVQSIISAYREKARREVIKEYPEIRAHMLKQRQQLRQNMRTRQSGLQAIADIGSN